MLMMSSIRRLRISMLATDYSLFLVDKILESPAYASVLTETAKRLKPDLMTHSLPDAAYLIGALPSDVKSSIKIEKPEDIGALVESAEFDAHPVFGKLDKEYRAKERAYKGAIPEELVSGLYADVCKAINSAAQKNEEESKKILTKLKADLGRLYGELDETLGLLR